MIVIVNVMNESLTELQKLEEIYCELYKDVYGVKARWYRADSVEEARNDLDRLSKVLEEEIEREQTAQAKAAATFEQTVQNVIKVGAKDRQTALQWLIDASEANGDWEYFCLLNELPYGYFKKQAA